MTNSIATPWRPLAALALLAGCATGPDETRVPIEAQAGRLPGEAAGFSRVAGTAPTAPPELGTARVAEYATARRLAVGLVFLHESDRPLVTVADVPAELDRAAADGARLGQRTGRALVERSRSTVTLPGGGSLDCATLGGTLGRNPVEWQVCVGAIGGRFLRTEVTMPSRNPPAADAAGFARAVAAAAQG